jgi:tetratricopeptide (TPR) repeat protein
MAMPQNKYFFAGVHASKESQFYDLPHGLSDRADVAELRKRIESGDDDQFGLLVLLGDRLCFQLRFREAIECYTNALDISPNAFGALRKRAPRYLCIQEPHKAFEDFLACAKMAPQTLELEYRLGISSYIKGDYETAELFFERSLELSESTPEMIAASSYWLAITALKTNSGKKKWMDFNFSLPVHVQTGYRSALFALCGFTEPEESAQNAIDQSGSLDGSIILYSACCMLEASNEHAKAFEILDKLVGWDDFWHSFAYLAAWREWSAKKLMS